jgi:hypothetical protein
MATPTYTLLDSVTLASSAASVTFSSIDQSYGDLVLVLEGQSTTGECRHFARLNGDSNSNYPYVQAYGTGSSSGSTSSTGLDRIYLTTRSGSTTDPLMSIGHIMDYSATDKHTAILSRGGTSQGGVTMIATRWANTAAVNSIYIFGDNPYAAGSTFYLYGIEK